MPALETKETQAPRSALRHRPLREAGTPGPAPLYRRASRVQGSVATQPPQTGAPVKSARNRRRLHPLLYLGLGMIAMFALLLVLSLAVSWWNTLMDDLHYGRPRTFQVDAVVGHGDSAATPSHFIALNYNGRVEVVEFPAGDASKARIFIGPQLYGAGSELVPVTLSFVDVSDNSWSISMNREVSTQRDRMNCQRSNATCTSMGNSFGFYYCSAPKSDWWGPASILDVKNWDVMAREKDGNRAKKQ